MTRRYPKGVQPNYDDVKSGDILLINRHTGMSKAIRVGQALRFRKERKTYAYWTHVAVVTKPGEIVEALVKGVAANPLEKYIDHDYVYVSIDAGNHDRAQMRAFAEACIGNPYGLLMDFSIGVALLTGANFLIGNPGTMICSGLAAQMLCRGDYIFKRDPNTIMPADLAEYFDIKSSF